MALSFRQAGLALAALGAASCSHPTGPLVLDGAPDFVGVVTTTLRRDFYPPGGYPLHGYSVFLAVTPSTTPNAGLLVRDSTPVFIEGNRALATATPAAISVGDSVRVWHDATVVPYSPNQAGCLAPPESLCYVATQVVVVR